MAHQQYFGIQDASKKQVRGFPSAHFSLKILKTH